MWDTAGTEKHRDIANVDYFQGTTGIILVYDVTDKNSFKNVSDIWLKKIYERADSNIELALIGNKTDLINNKVVFEDDAHKLLKTHFGKEGQT